MFFFKGLLLLLLSGSLVVWLAALLRLLKDSISPLAVLPDNVQADADESELVSVIIPAKDEKRNVRASLDSLLAQDYPNVEIVVVDDRSTDRTADIVRQVAAGDSRVRLIQVGSLPDGWCGKTHALHVGTGQARGRWLLFTDADCHHHPNSIRSGMAFLRAHRGDMLTLTPGFQTPGLAEKIVQPAVSTNFGVWFIFGSKDPVRAKRPFANGQYILIGRKAYDKAGGMAAVRNKVSEDISFARACHRANIQVLVGVGSKLFRTRMYDSLVGMWHGWSRIYYGAFETPGWLALVWLRTFAVAFLPFVALACSSAVIAVRGSSCWLAAMAGLSLATVILSMMASRRSYPLMGIPPRYVPAYPLGVFAALCFQLGAISRSLGLTSVTWRGTRYRRGRVEDARP